MVIQYSHRGFLCDIMGLEGLDATIIRFYVPALLHSLSQQHYLVSLPPPIQFIYLLRIFLQKRPVEDSDWRKNVEAMSGMEGRKKMFDAAKGPAQ